MTTEHFPLRQAAELRYEGHSPRSISQQLTEAGTPYSESTVRRHLLDAGQLYLPPARHLLRVRSLLQPGWGYGAVRRYAQTLIPERVEWIPTSAHTYRVVEACWPLCENTTHETAEAVAALIGLLHVPPDRHVRIEASEPVLALLRLHRDNPEETPLPRRPADMLAITHPTLRRAELAPEPEAHRVTGWTVRNREIPPLTDEWISERRSNVLLAAPAMASGPAASQEPGYGAWISDASMAQGSHGFAVFYRYTRLPLPLTPLYVLHRSGFHSSGEVEQFSVMCAWALAWLSGETTPVIHTDYKPLTTAGLLMQGPNRALLRLLDALPPSATEALDARWTSRSHPTIRHADAAAVAARQEKKRAPLRHRAAQARARTIELDWDTLLSLLHQRLAEIS